MTTFEWAMLCVSGAGCLITAGGVLGGCIWAVARIKEETTARIDAERIHTMSLLAAYAAEAAQERKIQEHNTAELGFSLRRHIENVEKKIGDVEIWGRDHYALKDDVRDVITEIRDDIRTLGTEIKADIRNLSSKVDAQALLRHT